MQNHLARRVIAGSDRMHALCARVWAAAIPVKAPRPQARLRCSSRTSVGTIDLTSCRKCCFTCSATPLSPPVISILPYTIIRIRPSAASQRSSGSHGRSGADHVQKNAERLRQAREEPGKDAGGHGLVFFCLFFFRFFSYFFSVSWFG